VVRSWRPLLRANQYLRVRLRSLAEKPQTVAAMLLPRPAAGQSNALPWLQEHSVDPGPQELWYPLPDFAPREPPEHPLLGRRVQQVAVVCWGAAVDAIVVEDIALMEPGE
jgi:hypothetical protein